MRLIASFMLILSTALAQVAMAQEPPTRVGRLAFTEGTVALYQDPDEGWEKAYVNSPVTSENSVWTDPSARAEMRVSGVAVRIDENTQLDIVKLDDDEFEAFVPQGSVAVRVRHFGSNDRLDFSTPHARFRLYGTGRYRIDVDAERDETVLTVFTGTVSMRSASGDIKVDAGNALRVEGGNNPSFVRMRARANAFDNWTLARDKGWMETQSVQYVSTDMTGYEDLDRYGSWSQEPDYGAVWYPRSVAADWVPYRQGHWDYVRPWGWTWVAEEPWGYAPYHYGRWVYVRNRWGWYPGPRAARPAWAPALVAWVGGANFSVGISGGSAPAMGWYPLAPWERYEPWYRTNTAYVNRINVVVRDNAPRQYQGRDRGDWRYANRDRGATVVQRDAFVSRRPVQQNVVRVAPETIRQAQVTAPATMLPGPEQFRRPARPAGQAPAAQAGRPGAPATAQAPQTAEQPFRRGGDRGAPLAKPNFDRRQAAPAPAAAPATAQQPAAQQPAAAPAARPPGRDDQRTQERAAQEAQRQQAQQQQQQREAQERTAREAQQQQQQQRDAQQRGARDAQQGAQQQQQREREAQDRAARDAQQQQQQQRQAQERAARDAQQAQERAAKDQQQQVQDRARAQERAAQEQQQRQQQQQQQQQQSQERAAQEAQRQQQQQQQAQERAAREQQQAQERAAREGQRGQPAQPGAQPPPGREAAPAQAPAQPAAQPPKEKEPPRGKDKDKEKDKDKDDEEKPGKGKGR